MKDEIEFLGMTNKGLEDVAVGNLQDILAKNIDEKKIRMEENQVTFKTHIDSALKVVYLTQAINRVILILSKFDFADKEHILQKFSAEMKKFKNHSMVKDGSSFKVEIKRLMDDDSFDTKDFESEIAAILYDDFKEKGITMPVNLKTPQITFYGVIKDSQFFIGIDLSGDLSKRGYKIFNNALSLKGTTAFGLLKIAGYTPKDIILNTFCNSGIIEIEAALYAVRKSHRFYDKNFPFLRLYIFDGFDSDSFFDEIDKQIKEQSVALITASDPLLRNLSAAKKNAKVAGVEKYIDFRRIDIDWLDTKFKKKTVDKMITFIQGSSKHKDYNNLEKMYKEFFYQAEYIIKDKGLVAVLCLSKQLLLEAASEYFVLSDEKELYSGEQLMHILFFKKKPKSESEKKS